jgi:hypothetical protein
LPWCDTKFDAKKVGAHRKKFCSPTCKDAFHTAARKWAHKALEENSLSISDLKAI